MTTPTSPSHPARPPDRPPSSSLVSSARFIDTSIDEDEDDNGDSLRFHTAHHPSPLLHHHTPLSQRSPAWASTSSSRSPAHSAHNSRSRLSRSHIPSLAAQGFSRPLSPQQLQAQRNLLHAGHAQGQGHSHSHHPHQDLPAIHDLPHDRASVVTASTNHNNDDTASTVRPSDCADTFRDNGVSWVSGTGRSSSYAGRRDLTGNGFFPQTQQQFAFNRQQGEQGQTQQHQTQPPQPQIPIEIEHQPIEAVDSERQGELPRPLRFPNWRQSSHSKGHSRLASNTTDLTHLKNQKQEEHEPKQPNLGRNYEYAVGNNVFCGKGRFMNSRDKPVNIMTGIMILLPCGLFFGYSAPFLWHHVSPAIPILFAYVAVLCFSSFLHASLADAGIMPRNLHRKSENDGSADPFNVEGLTTDWIMVKRRKPQGSAMEVPVKYCSTCDIWRPPRTYHCRVCDNCIETMDHHCVWLNNCVGRRNYRYFLSFVVTAILLACFLFGSCLAHCLLYKKHQSISFRHAIDEKRVPFALMIYAIVIGMYPVTLTSYHIFLMARGETTKEHLNATRLAKQERHRPYTQNSAWRNIVSVICRPKAPTYMQFKKAYVEGDQRLASKRRKQRITEQKTRESQQFQQNPPAHAQDNNDYHLNNNNNNNAAVELQQVVVGPGQIHQQHPSYQTSRG